MQTLVALAFSSLLVSFHTQWYMPRQGLREENCMEVLIISHG